MTPPSDRAMRDACARERTLGAAHVVAALPDDALRAMRPLLLEGLAEALRDAPRPVHPLVRTSIDRLVAAWRARWGDGVPLPDGLVP